MGAQGGSSAKCSPCPASSEASLPSSLPPAPPRHCSPSGSVSAEASASHCSLGNLGVESTLQGCSTNERGSSGATQSEETQGPGAISAVSKVTDDPGTWTRFPGEPLISSDSLILLPKPLKPEVTQQAGNSQDQQPVSSLPVQHSLSFKSISELVKTSPFPKHLPALACPQEALKALRDCSHHLQA